MSNLDGRILTAAEQREAAYKEGWIQGYVDTVKAENSSYAYNESDLRAEAEDTYDRMYGS